MNHRYLLFTLVIAVAFAHGQSSTERKQIVAVRATDAITIDGILDEPAWQRPGYADFLQRDPVQGAAPSEKTEVWVAFDDAAIYVAARLYDHAPDSIMALLARRDGFQTADWFGVFLDPYLDRQTGYFFAVSAGGTIADGVLYNDGWDDPSWDGVWDVKTRIDHLGWTVEMKIPFSQLRFHQSERYVWGINFRRDIGRNNESDYVVYTPRNESGFVSRFANLIGIDGVTPSRQIELLPYATTRAEFLRPQARTPFNDGSKYLPGGGADLKMGLSSNLTLNATINPDFGQVEVDPAVVNLSDVESFFGEKRPFFVEGSTIFNFGQGGANDYWNFNFPWTNHFYSRRIGRAPQGSVPAADYVDAPVGTRILGAGKVTGKLDGNWNIGMIHAVTNREYAELMTGGVRARAEIEPLTYYGVARAKKEFNGGAQAVGLMSTYVNRMFQDARLRDELNANALFTGVDGYTFLDEEREWVITGWMGATRVTGTRERMIRLQRNSQHYFQRPDAPHVRVDSNATSMTGTAMRVWLNKQKGNMFLNAAFGYIDPRFEINDLGFLGRTDAVNSHVGVGYRWSEPTDWYRRIQTLGAVFVNYDFAGNLTGLGVFQSTFIQLPNYLSFRYGVSYSPQTVNNRRTRGGPLMLNKPGYDVNISAFSDDRKPVQGDVFGGTSQSEQSRSFYLEGGMRWQPAPNVWMRVGPGFSREFQAAQWVMRVEDPTAGATFGSRYVFAELDQTTLSANIRLNWTFTPTLSLQLYLQPLISAGSYRRFKELARPKSFDFRVYGENGSTITRDGSTYTVDPDGAGPAGSFSFDSPNFNFKSLRGNAVLRWEYLPGSTLYFVWTQSRSDWENNGDFRLNHSLHRMVSTSADNVFMIKMTYWLSM